ncbi:MAG TPA: hypothetical protein VGO91_18640 [Pyrinomonadaceae bacterium]|jgi:hypothetical protein|nr:hypothetical protein [Pyrinomonadaceae bacterium]
MKKSGRRDDIHETPDVSHIQNEDVSHERSDVNVKSIIIFAVGLAVLTGIVLVLMSLMYNVLDAREREQEGPRAPMALTENEHMPPEPRLQAAPGFGVDVDKNQRTKLEEQGYIVDENGRVNLSLREPQAEMKVVRQRWQEELEGQQPDRQTGQQRMPINQAMQMLIQQGVPTRQPAQGTQGNQQAVKPMDEHGMELPSFWSAGQQTEKRDQ